MKLILKKAGLLLMIVSISPLSYSQSVKDKEKAIGDIKYSEELFVQTDRDIYIAGERVYLKIYKLNGITRTPGNVSQVVYVDMLDNSDNPVAQIKSGIKDFSGAAEFVIPDTLRTGNYLVRSCTNWMQNFSGSLYSYKRISVINPFENINKIKVPVKGVQPDSVKFYPEGGQIVSGLENVVGIKCFNKDGNPIGIKGIVVDSNNDTLCNVVVDNRGIGFFTVRPSGNGKIYLMLQGSVGSAKKIALPAVDETGISLSVKSSRKNGMLLLHIRQTSDLTAAGRRLHLIYSPVLTAPIKKEIKQGAEADISLSKDSLPAGLARVMIFDENGQPLALRWVYNEKSRRIDYDIKVQDTVSMERSRVKVGITARSDDGSPIRSDLVVSVVKSFTIDQTNGGDIPEYRQLPSIATMNTDMTHFDINDYLIFYPGMDDFLKHGIRPDHLFLPELGGLLVSGRITSNSTGEPIKNENIILSFVGKAAQCKFTRTDEHGNFNFVTNESGTKEIVIEPLSAEQRDYSIEINNPFPDVLGNNKTAPFYPDSTQLTEINKAIISMQVKGIYDPFVKSDNCEPKEAEELNFYDEPVQTILISDYIELNSLREIIKELIPGLTIYKKDDRSFFRMVNESQNPMFETPPMVLVDGVVIDDLDKILAMSPKDLEKIEVLKSRYFISDIVLEGIVNFVTKKGNLSALDFDRSLFRQEYQALQPPFRFFSPDYSVDSLKDNRIPDFRNTLYWNPDLKTDEDGKADLEFYTSDESGEYTIIVEGITRDGKTGKSEISFFVKGK
jgi:hypothetical protein